MPSSTDSPPFSTKSTIQAQLQSIHHSEVKLSETYFFVKDRSLFGKYFFVLNPMQFNSLSLLVVVVLANRIKILIETYDCSIIKLNVPVSYIKFKLVLGGT